MLLKIPGVLGVMLCHWVSSSDVSKDCSALEMSDTSYTVSHSRRLESSTVVVTD